MSFASITGLEPHGAVAMLIPLEEMVIYASETAPVVPRLAQLSRVCTTGDATMIEFVHDNQITVGVVVQVFSCVFVIWSTNSHSTALLHLARSAAGQVDVASRSRSEDYFRCVSRLLGGRGPHPKGAPLSKDGHEAPRFSALIHSFTAETIQLMMTLLLSEYSVMFVASTSSSLADCCFAIRAFLYPFRWPHEFAPLAAFSNRKVLLSVIGEQPVPFIGGLLVDERPLFMLLSSSARARDSKIWVADCQTGTVLPARTQRTLYTIPPSQTLRDALSSSGVPAAVYPSVLEYWVRHCVGEYRKSPQDPYSFMFPSLPSSDRSALVNQIFRSRVFREFLDKTDDSMLKPFNDECARQFPELFSQASKSTGLRNFFATKTRQLKSWSQGVSAYYARYTSYRGSVAEEHPTRSDFDAGGRLPLDVINSFEDFHTLIGGGYVSCLTNGVPTKAPSPPATMPSSAAREAAPPDRVVCVESIPQAVLPSLTPSPNPNPIVREVVQLNETKIDPLDAFLSAPTTAPEGGVVDKHKAALDLSSFR